MLRGRGRMGRNGRRRRGIGPVDTAVRGCFVECRLQVRAHLLRATQHALPDEDDRHFVIRLAAPCFQRDEFLVILPFIEIERPAFQANPELQRQHVQRGSFQWRALRAIR